MSAGQIRSFVSIDLDDEEILSRIESIISSLESLGGDLKPVERENVHLTLKFLGNVSSSRLSEVKLALSRLIFEPFTMKIKGTGAFPSLTRMNVIWVGISEGWSQIEQIYEQTETLLDRVGFSRETRPFNPHITIARVRSGRKREEIAAFLNHLAEETLGTFNAQHVRLKQSILSPLGPRYSTLFEATGRK